MTRLWTAKELIRCEECDSVQEAETYFDDRDPFPTYIHECSECGYINMESTWNVIHD